MRHVLVTGATGFVGSALCRELAFRGWQFECVVRRQPRIESRLQSVPVRLVAEIGPETDWSGMFGDADAVVHLAARVHVMHDTEADPLQAFRQVNTDGTLRLARAAAEAGVRRFVYLSSIKVNGERTREQPFREGDPPAPEDPYAISKWEAEQGLFELAEETSLEVAIVRPPLVYGPGVKANFHRLIRIVEQGVPLPLDNCCNRRSLVALPNLVDLIIRCLEHPAAVNQIFFVTDGEDLSTPELIRRIARALGVAPRLFSFPLSLLNLAARLAGLQAQIERLTQSLQVDTGKARRLLDWQPPLDVDSALGETITRYRQDCP